MAFGDQPHAEAAVANRGRCQAASQRDIVRVIEAASIVAEKNYEYLQAGKGTPVTAVLEETGIRIVEP